MKDQKASEIINSLFASQNAAIVKKIDLIASDKLNFNLSDEAKGFILGDIKTLELGIKCLEHLDEWVLMIGRYHKPEKLDNPDNYTNNINFIIERTTAISIAIKNNEDSLRMLRDFYKDNT